MVKLKAGVSDATGYFNLNGLDYQQGLWEVFYNGGSLLSDGTRDLTTVRIGIRSIEDNSNVLQTAIKASSYVNSFDTPYTLDGLLSDLISVGGFKSGSTTSSVELATELTLQNGLFTKSNFMISGLVFPMPIDNSTVGIVFLDSNGTEVNSQTVSYPFGIPDATELKKYVGTGWFGVFNDARVVITDATTLSMATNPLGIVKFEIRDLTTLEVYASYNVTADLSDTLSQILDLDNGVISHEELTSVTPKVYTANSYKEITFVLESGSVTVNDGTNDIVYLDSDRSVGYSFKNNRGISEEITFTLGATSKVRVVTKSI